MAFLCNVRVIPRNIVTASGMILYEWSTEYAADSINAATGARTLHALSLIHI